MAASSFTNNSVLTHLCTASTNCASSLMTSVLNFFLNDCYIIKLYSQVDLICLRLLYLNSHSDEFSGWLPERKRSVLAEIKLVNTSVRGRYLVRDYQLPQIDDDDRHIHMAAMAAQLDMPEDPH